MLTRQFCQWLLCAPLVRQIARAVKFTFIPDEIFFQAAIMNSPFREQRTDCHRYVVWPGPKILGNEDFQAIIDSECLLARKFDACQDRQVLERLARHCGFVPPVPV